MKIKTKMSLKLLTQINTEFDFTLQSLVQFWPEADSAIISLSKNQFEGKSD